MPLPVYFFFFFKLCFSLLWIFTAACKLSLVAASGACSCFRAQALEARGAVVWLMGLVALPRVASPQTRDQTPVFCTGRQILNCWATREVLLVYF